MKMRVSIARALVTRPKLLLMDEPFAALDEITRFKLNNDLLRLWQSQRWTVVFVTHSVFESVYLSTRVVVMAARPGPGRGRNRRSTHPTRATRRSAPRPTYNAFCREASALLHAPWASERMPRADAADPRLGADADSVERWLRWLAPLICGRGDRAPGIWSCG